MDKERRRAMLGEDDIWYDYDWDATQEGLVNLAETVAEKTGIKNDERLMDAVRTVLRYPKYNEILSEYEYYYRFPWEVKELMDSPENSYEKEGAFDNKRNWAEIRCDYIDINDMFWRVDAWETNNDCEEGKVIAYIDDLTGRVLYADPRAIADEYAQEVVSEMCNIIAERRKSDTIYRAWQELAEK